jgi:FkbM family methyltransferase
VSHGWDLLGGHKHLFLTDDDSAIVHHLHSLSCSVRMKGSSSSNGPQRRGKSTGAGKAWVVVLIVVTLATIFAGDAWSNSYITSLETSYLASLEGLETTFGIGSTGSSKSKSSSVESLLDRVQYLETKLNAYLAFTSDPFLANKSPAKCEKSVMIKEIACKADEKCELDDQEVCLDTFPVIGGATDAAPSAKSAQSTAKNGKKNCVVYDFGIRESPEYGLAFAKAPFDCQVVGFDPSPVSVEWWKKEKDNILAKYPGYTFHAVGAAGHDGMLELREYDWGQVSIVEFPTRVVDVTRCTGQNCKYTFHKKQGSFNIPVKTLATVMKELGHQRVNLLKVDVEGGEYTFLEKMIDDLSCRKVDQITMEWHHYNHDIRYGVTSSPQRNLIVALLSERCGLEQFWTHDGAKGWPSNQKLYAEMGITLYYTLTSFKRVKWDF